MRKETLKKRGRKLFIRKQEINTEKNTKETFCKKRIGGKLFVKKQEGNL